MDRSVTYNVTLDKIPNVLVKRRVRSTRPVAAEGQNALERFVMCAIFR
jgi:hypothetical protein